MEIMKLSDYMKMQNKKLGIKKSKYNNQRSEHAGESYQSKAEANYARNLDLMKIATTEKDRVVKWERQIKFPIAVKKKHICNYYLDFKVEYADGRTEYVDVKGYQKGVAYGLFTIKKKLVEALYGITIIEHTGGE